MPGGAELTMRVAIIGAGLQMRRRAPVIRASRDDTLVVIAGTTLEPAGFEQYHCAWSRDWRSAVKRDDIDIVIVCTPPHKHAEITIAAFENGKHVLCEKTLCSTLAEARA